jgi:hypothetical protein
MSKTQHTKGTWYTDVPDPAFVNYDVRTDETIICTMGIDMGVEEEAANARLIAAAPELLEALEKLEQTASFWKDMGVNIPVDDLTQARAAIAKARQG